MSRHRGSPRRAPEASLPNLNPSRQPGRTLTLNSRCRRIASPAVAPASGMEARRGEDQRSGAQRSRQPGPAGRRQTARPSPESSGTHPCPREGGALSTQTKKGRLCRSEAKASRLSRDRLKMHPQEGQHSAASLRDPGPSASASDTYRARRSKPKPRRSFAARFTRARPAEPDAKRHSCSHSPVNLGRQYRAAGEAHAGFLQLLLHDRLIRIKIFRADVQGTARHIA